MSSFEILILSPRPDPSVFSVSERSNLISPGARKENLGIIFNLSLSSVIFHPKGFSKSCLPSKYIQYIPPPPHFPHCSKLPSSLASNIVRHLLTSPSAPLTVPVICFQQSSQGYLFKQKSDHIPQSLPMAAHLTPRKRSLQDPGWPDRLLALLSQSSPLAPRQVHRPLPAPQAGQHTSASGSLLLPWFPYVTRNHVIVLYAWNNLSPDSYTASFSHCAKAFSNTPCPQYPQAPQKVWLPLVTAHWVGSSPGLGLAGNQMNRQPLGLQAGTRPTARACLTFLSSIYHHLRRYTFTC